MRYDTLDQLHTAFQSGELDGECVSLDSETAEVYVNDECVFMLHINAILEQALDLLTIPHELA